MPHAELDCEPDETCLIGWMSAVLTHHPFMFGFIAGEVKSSVDLDREVVPVYEFFAQATDGGGRWCRAEIKLTITDVNDNPPIFTLSQYTASVYEDTTPKALLTCIQAIDPDEGSNRTTCTSREQEWCYWSQKVS